MAGKIRKIIDEIIQERSKGNPAITEMTIAKLILKGLNPNKFHNNSPDDLVTIKKLYNIAKQLNIKSFENKGINIKAVFSTKSLEEEVVLDIKEQLNVCNTKLVIFFAAPNFDQDKISNLMQKAFEEFIVVGCSTSGEIVSGKLLKNSVVAMAINSNIISDIKVEVIENIKENLNVEPAFTSFEKYYNESLYTMDSKKFVGISLIDGMSMKEEHIMDLIGDRTNVFFVGGSAGDNRRYIKTHVYANGKSYTNSAVLIMLKINDNAEFSVIKTQSFKALDHTFIANKVNEEMREVIEFNNKPAVLAYAEAVGASSIEDIPKYFTTNSLGLVVGEDNMLIRTPQQINGTSMLFHCNILEGMEVRLLKSTNIIEDTKNAIESKIKGFGKFEGLINFNCVERTLELEEKNLGKQYAEIFSDIPTIGFSTYGEQFIGHMNRTASMLVFRSKTNT